MSAISVVPATDRVVAALTQAGHQPRQRGDKWEALCPADDDSTPSLSVSQGSAGALIHCHAGCPTDRIVEELGLTVADLFDEPRGQKTERRRIVAEYPYTDERGELLYHVVRYSPKGFSQRRADGKWTLAGVRRVPYRLPALVAAPDDAAIYVPEGEKDADAIVREGEIATCNSGGAGKWNPAFAKHFKAGQQVIICADDDAPGYQHALDVARDLEGHVAEIIVALPKIGKDVAEHLGGGLTLDEMRTIGSTSLAALGDGLAVASDQLVNATIAEAKAIITGAWDERIGRRCKPSRLISRLTVRFGTPTSRRTTG